MIERIEEKHEILCDRLKSCEKKKYSQIIQSKLECVKRVCSHNDFVGPFLLLLATVAAALVTESMLICPLLHW